MLRALAERLSRGRSLRRRLPAAFGRTPLYVSPDAQLKYLKAWGNAFDAELLRVAAEEIGPGSAVWDIGANVGVFAFAAASRAVEGHVVAVEPDLFLAGLLRRSAALPENRHLDVRVVPAAVSDRVGVQTFLVARRGLASNALESAGGRSQMGGVRERVSVPTLTLDALLESFPAPDFVKIDVEGAELPVLRGATRLLASVRPVLYVEVDDATADSVTALLRAADYALFDGSAKGGRREVERCAPDTLARPRSGSLSR